MNFKEVLLEKRSRNKANPFEINEMREEMNLFFERLNVKSEFNRIVTPLISILQLFFMVSELDG